MNEPVKPSIPVARCLGPVPLSEEYHTQVNGKGVPFEEAPDERKVLLLKYFCNIINKRERSIWIAAERLSDFGDGQQEIYSELLEAACKE